MFQGIEQANVYWERHFKINPPANEEKRKTSEA